ncbi:MAG: hypothetical protein AMXMBFR13_25450 [Phycisphaerae bacterium]
MMKRLLVLLAAGLLSGSSFAFADFTAYVDLAGRSGDANAANVVKFLEPIGGSRVLKDFSTGADTSVTLTMTASTSPIRSHLDGTTGSASYTLGTPAHSVFAGIVDPSGYLRDDQVPNPIQPPFANVALDFTGLNPAKTYELVLFGSRQGSGVVTPTRSVQFTLSDVDSFTNASSIGAVFGGPADPSTSYDSGGATNQTLGLVAQYVNVQPGADGDMRVLVTAPSNSPSGKWYANALRVVEVPEPTALCMLLAAAPMLLRRRRRQ